MKPVVFRTVYTVNISKQMLPQLCQIIYSKIKSENGCFSSVQCCSDARGENLQRKTASSYVTVTKRVNKLHIETTQLGLACRVFSSPPT